jgi:hypothetical protein
MRSGRYRDRTIDRAADQEWNLLASNKPPIRPSQPKILECALCASLRPAGFAPQQRHPKVKLRAPNRYFRQAAEHHHQIEENLIAACAPRTKHQSTASLPRRSNIGKRSGTRAFNAKKETRGPLREIGLSFTTLGPNP